MVSEKRAKTCIYWKLGKICYERLQNIRGLLLHSFFRNSSKSHESENTRIFFQKSARIWVNFFASLVMQNFLPHTWGDVWWNKRICHTQLKPRSWTIRHYLVGKWPLFSPNNVYYPTTPPMQNIGNPLLTIYHSELGKYIIFIEQETSKISLVKPAYRSVYHSVKYTN